MYIECFESIDYHKLYVMTSSKTNKLLNRLRMRQLMLILSINKHGTLRGAADEMAMSQPAATKMLQELEESLQMKLFSRTGRNLKFNEAGRRVLDYFEGIEGTLTALNREMQEVEKGHLGKLVIGSIMAASPAILSKAIIKIKEEFPLLNIEIIVDTSDRLTESLEKGEMDLAIGRIPQSSTHTFNFDPLAEENLSIVCRAKHPLTYVKNIHLKDINQYPWILQPHGSPMRDVIESELKIKQVPIQPAPLETSSILTTKNLLLQSDMVAVIPQDIANIYSKFEILAILDYTITTKLNPYGIITTNYRPQSNFSKTMINYLKKYSQSTL
jgi:DNA-binding transcriptional LysR family regulator